MQVKLGQYVFWTFRRNHVNHFSCIPHTDKRALQMIIHLPEITQLSKNSHQWPQRSNSPFINVPSSDQTDADRQLKRQSPTFALCCCVLSLVLNAAIREQNRVRLKWAGPFDQHHWCSRKACKKQVLAGKFRYRSLRWSVAAWTRTHTFHPDYTFEIVPLALASACWWLDYLWRAELWFAFLPLVE